MVIEGTTCWQLNGQPQGQKVSASLPPWHRVADERHTGLYNMQDQIRLLKQEKVKMEERRQASVRLFRDWKTHLLADSDHGKTVDAFLAHCILPRCVLTAEDATYCAAFIRKLVLEDTPYFSFMFLMQQVGAAAPVPCCRHCLQCGSRPNAFLRQTG